MQEKGSVKNRPRHKMSFGLATADRQSLLYACGMSYEDLEKPLIGIITQTNEVHPGEIHVSRIVEQIKYSIYEKGGTPALINISGYCDGVIGGNKRYIFPQRNLIADSIEVAAEANLLDGMVLVASCDKNVPAALMAAGRTNLPSIVVTGGIMAPGYLEGKDLTVDNITNVVGKKIKREIDEYHYKDLIKHSCTGGGACSILTTGTSMQIICESLGMSLPGNSSMLGMGREILDVARSAGKIVMDLYRKNLCPRDIIVPGSIENAIKVAHAIGSSMHLLYHIPAVGVEAGIEMDYWSLFDKFSDQIPVLVGILPNGPYNMLEYHRAGGTPVLMKKLEKYLNGSVLTVMGNPIKSYYDEAITTYNPEIIHTVEDPWKKGSGLAILKGNIAPMGSIVRASGVKDSMMEYIGVARVFDNEKYARKELIENTPKNPTVFVVKNQGMRGACGINSLLSLSSEIIGMGLEDNVAIVTDGRFSGGARGLCIGLVSPEAADGGNINYINDGDEIEINIPDRKLEVKISEEEINKRKEKETLAIKTPKSIFLKIFLESVQPLYRGGVSGRWTRTGYKRITEPDEVSY